ncbi:hypothetical protein EDC01DRAFT_626442 [Geopyxis carbonaria]|nr:hypothetical protein EDC01DRAFT_626442 [Geopyxis carbonaria]
MPYHPNKNYERKMGAAVKEYKTKEYTSLRKTAEAYGVCSTTLRDRINGATTRAESSMQKQALTDKEEQTVLKTIDDLTNKNCPIGSKVLREIGTNINYMFGIVLELTQSAQWYKTARFWIISLIGWKKHTIYINLNYKNIYNLDEKGFLLGMSERVKIIIHKYSDHFHSVAQDGNRELVTVLKCISADGYVATPCIILVGEYHNYGWFPTT